MALYSIQFNSCNQDTSIGLHFSTPSIEKAWLNSTHIQVRAAVVPFLSDACLTENAVGIHHNLQLQCLCQISKLEGSEMSSSCSEKPCQLQSELNSLGKACLGFYSFTHLMYILSFSRKAKQSMYHFLPHQPFPTFPATVPPFKINQAGD